MRLSFTCLLCLFCQLSFSQRITSEKMYNDIDFYFNTLECNHPCLYKMINESKFDSLRIDLKLKCKDDMEVKDFYRILLSLNQYTDGHTQVLKQKIFNSDPSVFLNLKVIDNTFMLNNDRVLSINNKDITEIMIEVKSFSSKEGGIHAKELNICKILPEYLSVFHSIKLPYIIKSINQKGDTNTCVISQLDSLRRVTREKLLFNFYPEESVAVIFYNSSDFNRYEREFEKTLSLGFTKMNELKIKHLFIDIRSNGGGFIHYNNILLQYLRKNNNKTVMHTLVPKVVVEEQLKLNYERLNKRFPNNLWGSLRKQMILLLKRKKILKFERTGIVSERIKSKTLKKCYKGNVYLIQGRETYSAAILLAEEFKRKQIGVIVGEDNGAPIPFSSGPINYTLPNSKISFTCSFCYSWYTPPVETCNGFILPDIEYDVFNKILTIEDYKQIIEYNRNNKK